MPEVKRQTAYKCSINMILAGEYIQRPGWDPNYIQIGDLSISRINLLAVIVEKEASSITLDDGTGQIQAMVFGDQNKIANVNVGDLVQLIGRPREYNQKRFIVPEIIKIIEDKRWIDYRKAELQIYEEKIPKIMEAPIVSQKNKFHEEEAQELLKEVAKEEQMPEQKFEDNYASIILSCIRKIDKGDGASVNDVIKQSGLEKADKYIISLINEGEIFEIRTGKLKILE